MKSIRTDPRNHAVEGDERIRTAARWLGAVFAYVRRSDPVAPAPTNPPRVFDMDARKGWGNRISWFDWDRRRIEGHTTPKPRVGDEVRCRLQSGAVGRFRVVAVEHVNGVPDMFFAHVEDVGYVDADSPPLTRFGVFGEELARAEAGRGGERSC